MIYYVEERKDGYAVIGRGHKRSAEIDLTKTQADRLAHRLAGSDGYIGWKDIEGKFTGWCSCADCKPNTP
jgi:hypothetical protein